MSEIDDLLSFDGLSVAEKITGASYKEDAETEALGLLLHLRAVEAKRTELSLRDDTHYSSSFADAARIYKELGFEKIHEHAFKGHQTEESFQVLWHPEGVLGTLESYTWAGDRPPSANNIKIYFNHRHRDPDEYVLWSMSGSGHVVADVSVASLDVREGFRHQWAKLRDQGKFVSPWIERPFIWLVDYSQPSENCEYKAITQAVIDTFPSEVKEAIGA